MPLFWTINLFPLPLSHYLSPLKGSAWPQNKWSDPEQKQWLHFLTAVSSLIQDIDTRFAHKREGTGQSLLLEVMLPQAMTWPGPRQTNDLLQNSGPSSFKKNLAVHKSEISNNFHTHTHKKRVKNYVYLTNGWAINRYNFEDWGKTNYH